MGFNSTVIVLNDALNEIEQDRGFGRKVAEAIRELDFSGNRHIDISSGCHCNAASAVETHHADQTAVVSIGGNCGQVLGRAHGWDYDLRKPEDKERLLKQLAGDLGFSIRRKSNWKRAGEKS